MKGAYLISREPSVFRALCEFFKSTGREYVETEKYFWLKLEGDIQFLLFDRENGDAYEKYEITREAEAAGYIYGLLAECRGEEAFCDLIASVPNDIDILVCDGNNKIYTRGELSASTIVL